MSQKTKATQTVSRKQQHVELCVDEDVQFRSKSTGFEYYEFEHNALPEINYSDISLRTEFFGKIIEAPLLISCMTGGYPDAERINGELAEVCEELGIAMGVGSQRQALEDTSYHSSFSVVRKRAPSIPIIGNIGAAEIAKMPSADSLKKITELIGADALAIHLNPLQELLQPEGTPDFSGVLRGIEHCVKSLAIPVIVKEVGAGISSPVAQKLLSVGARGIDVAGAGGTSWAGVELLRKSDSTGLDVFWDWGIPTAECVHDVASLKSSVEFMLIASGGLNSGLDVAKSIALGADMAASARPLLKALLDGGREGLVSMISIWLRQLRHVMFLTGCSNINALKDATLYRNSH